MSASLAPSCRGSHPFRPDAFRCVRGDERQHSSFLTGASIARHAEREVQIAWNVFKRCVEVVDGNSFPTAASTAAKRRVRFHPQEGRSARMMVFRRTPRRGVNSSGSRVHNFIHFAAYKRQLRGMSRNRPRAFVANVPKTARISDSGRPKLSGLCECHMH